jgi:hypothetical protein
VEAVTSQQYAVKLALALDHATHDAGNAAAREAAPVMRWLDARGLGLNVLYTLDDPVRDKLEVQA